MYACLKLNEIKLNKRNVREISINAKCSSNSIPISTSPNDEKRVSYIDFPENLRRSRSISINGQG